MTPISKLGEFQLIDRMTKPFEQRNDQVVKSFGDDAAVVRIGGGQVQVYSTDLLLEGVHFDLAYAPLKHLGYKAIAVNLSDIFAMNAIPFGVTVSLGLSNRFTVEAVDELYTGIKMACDRYGIDLLGGDTTSSQQGLVISVTAFGQAKEEEIVYRSGAQPTDLICVTGDLGAAYAGLLVLDREKASFMSNPELQPDLNDYDYVASRQLKPEPRGDAIQRLRELGVQPTSMMDISDGLGSELHHLCKQSGTGAVIYASKLPLDYQTMKVAEEFEISPTTFAMNGGEDYELVFTLPLHTYEKIKGEEMFHIVGRMSDDSHSVQIVLENGGIADVEAQGWDHFKEEEE
jgi:thiamine-monophosphate kinase